jgi:hypothetical protein
VATFLFVIAFRGGMDVLAHKLIPRASLYGAGRELLAERRAAGACGTGATSTASPSSLRCSSAAVLSDPGKQAAAAQILGQAYLTAVCCMRHNREAVARVADALVQRRELYGDEVIDLLEAAEPHAPAIDVSDRSIWPKV